MAIEKWQPPRKVTYLHSVRSLNGGGFEECILAHPVMAGPQPCIIRSVKPGKITMLQVEDALVLVPSSVPALEGFPDPEFSGYLAIAEQEYKKLIHPQRVKKVPKKRGVARSQHSSIEVQGIKGSAPLQFDILRRGDAGRNKRRREEWLIVSRWTDWVMRGMTRAQQFDEHCWNQGKTPPTGIGRRKEIERFRWTCRKMNLPPSRFR